MFRYPTKKRPDDMDRFPSGHYAGSQMGGGSCRRGPLHEQVFRSSVHATTTEASGLPPIRENLAIYLSSQDENSALKQKLLESPSDLLHVLIQNIREALKIPIEPYSNSTVDLLRIGQFRRMLALIKEIASILVKNSEDVAEVTDVLTSIAKSNGYFSLEAKLSLFCIRTEEQRATK